MHKALGTYVVANQSLAVGDTIQLTKYAGNPVNGLSVDNNAIVIKAPGTYSITGYVNVAATAEGNVQVALFNNGTQISNTAVTVTAAGAGDNVVLPIKYTIYVPATCCPMQIANRPRITIQLIEGPGTTVAGIVDVEN